MYLCEFVIESTLCSGSTFAVKRQRFGSETTRDQHGPQYGAGGLWPTEEHMQRLGACNQLCAGVSQHEQQRYRGDDPLQPVVWRPIPVGQYTGITTRLMMPPMAASPYMDEAPQCGTSTHSIPTGDTYSQLISPLSSVFSG